MLLLLRHISANNTRHPQVYLSTYVRSKRPSWRLRSLWGCILLLAKSCRRSNSTRCNQQMCIQLAVNTNLHISVVRKCRIFTKIHVQCRRWKSVVCDRLFGCLGDERAV